MTKKREPKPRRLMTAEEIVAALALGAEGINMGTRFMCTAESPIHENIKQQIVDNDERATDPHFRTMHNTSRVAKNATSQKVGALDPQGTEAMHGTRRGARSRGAP